MRVLVIDDSADLLQLAKARLAAEGVDVCCAESGREGLEAARRLAPDLVLLDLDMPDMSGFDVCRELKSDAKLCMTPVIFLSGSASAADKVQGLDLGAVDFVTKPFDAFELRARVRAALRTKQLQDMLIEYAHMDPLTGLPNRRALMERLSQEWDRISRHGGTMSVVMGDVDHFKRVNDTFGHAVGDSVLRSIARILMNECRSVDMVARSGGEEFVVVVPNSGADGALRLAERCRGRIEEMAVASPEGRVRATMSFGVAEKNDHRSVEALLKDADEQLYSAKQAGRNRVWSARPVTAK